MKLHPNLARRVRARADAPSPREPCIALVSPGWPRERFPNGIVSAIDELLPAFERLAVDVRVLAVEGQVPPDDRRFVPLRPALRRRAPSRVLSALRWKLRPSRTHLVEGAGRILRALDGLRRERHVDLLEMEESFGWAGPVAERAGIPVVVVLHGPWFLHGPLNGDADGRAFRWRVRAEGQALRRAHAVLAPSRDVLERTRAHYGLDLPDADVIPYPVSARPPAERWRAAEIRRDEVLFAGRFDAHKGGDLLLDAFAIVLREHPSARLVFVGPDRGVVDARGRPWSAREYADARLPGAIGGGRLELLGARPPDELDRLRRRAALTVSCSRYENLSLAALEAMSLGCPLVVADRGGLTEHVRDGENGRSFPAGDAGALARAILDLLRDPERAERLGREAARYVERELDPLVLARRRLAFHRRVMTEHARRSGTCAT